MSNKDADDIMRDVKKSLAEQVNSEYEEQPLEVKKAPKKKKNKFLSFIKGVLIALVIAALILLFLVFTKPGRKILIHFATEYAYSKIDYAGAEDEEITVESIREENGGIYYPNVHMDEMSDTYKKARHEEGVTNILLIGVEAIGYGQAGGHTDALMIATINKNKGTLSLTSLMRDSWVTIPGYTDGRINTAYAKGGINGLFETIAYNYDIRIDGYALVGFDSFEKLVDAVGGVDIELTEEEAKYLNKTNYISKKKYRKVKAGMNHFNGNQALGYCRVRKVATLDGSNYDMGRTSRQRRVLNAIFTKVKKSNISELVNLMNTVLPIVETNIRKNNCKNYLADLFDVGLESKELKMLRLPTDGGYTSENINGASVLVPKWDETKTALHNLVFNGKLPEDYEEKKENKN